MMHTRQTRAAARGQGPHNPRAATFRASPDVRHILRGAAVQPRLKIGAANDPAEREADRVADQVMRMPEPGTELGAATAPTPPGTGSNLDSGPNPIRRMCAGCQDELQRKPIDAEELVRPKDAPGAAPALSASSEGAIRGLGRGAPMPVSERAFFEPRFGQDFSGVRLHTGLAAHDAANAINARAFTLGSDIVFARGEYAPGSATGRRLLAHELTHTMQQSGRLAQVQSKPDRSAVSVSHSSPVQVSRQVFREKRDIPASDGGQIVVTRTVTPGQCRFRPGLQTGFTHSPVPGQTIFGNAPVGYTLEISACHGTTSGRAGGTIDFGQAINNASTAITTFLSNPTASGARDQLAASISQSAPHADIWFEIGNGQITGSIVAGGQVDLTGQVSGGITAGVTFPISDSLELTLGGTLSGGTGQPPIVGPTATLVWGSPQNTDNCEVCRCQGATLQYSCGHIPPLRPSTGPSPIQLPVFRVPVQYLYNSTDLLPGMASRISCEIIPLVEQGYTIAEVVGNASPEGPELRQRPPPGFEGNIILAQARAERTWGLVQAELRRRAGPIFGMRGVPEGQQRFLTVSNSSPPVRGRNELFGRAGGNETPDPNLLARLESLTDEALEAASILGDVLPGSIRMNNRAAVGIFRDASLPQDQRLEALYSLLRRGLVVLIPPVVPTPSINFRLSPSTLSHIVGENIPCEPEHQALFAGVPIPEEQRFDNQCQEGRTRR